MNPSALSCPACHSLTRSAELASLAAEAQQAMRQGDFLSARAQWEKSLALLPADSVQYRNIRAHIENLDSQIAAAPPAQQSAWKKSAAGVGPAAALLWKLK